MFNIHSVHSWYTYNWACLPTWRNCGAETIPPLRRWNELKALEFCEECLIQNGACVCLYALCKRLQTLGSSWVLKLISYRVSWMWFHFALCRAQGNWLQWQMQVAKWTEPFNVCKYLLLDDIIRNSIMPLILRCWLCTNNLVVSTHHLNDTAQTCNCYGLIGCMTTFFC